MFDIRNVTVEDTKALLQIYTPYVLNTAITFEYDVPSEEEFAERIRTISAKYPYLKAVDRDGQIVGYAYASSFKGRKAYDWSVETTVYVEENHKGQGIGKMLYHTLEKSLKEQGILNMNACIGIPKTADDPYCTDASVHFHEALGFSMIGTFHDSGFKFNRWYDMCWMEKMIGEHTNHPEENPFK